MLTNNVPDANKDITVERHPLEIIVSDDGKMPLRFLLPPLEDILEMKALKDTHFSLKEHAENRQLQFQKDFEDELEFLEKKSEKYIDSPVFLNRLANFAEFSRQLDKEAQYLNLAKKLSSDPFFDHRIGDNLISRNKFSDAEKLFSTLNLESDLYANLRLAYFCIQRKDFNAASIFIGKALNINPLDYGSRMLEGALRLFQGEYELAIHSFRAASEDRQGSAALYTNMAIAYLYLQKKEKALHVLKRAVFLEPLNEGVVMFLADLAFNERCNELSINSLRYFLEFEQKNPAIWARLARALLCLGKPGEAIAALKRQGSIQDTSSVWNNLGVAYIQQNNLRKAHEALFHALRKDSDKRGRDYLLAARNICHLLSNGKYYKELMAFSSEILKDNNLDLIKNDPVLSDIIVFKLHSLWQLNKKDELATFSKNIICEDHMTPRLKAWIVTLLIAYYANIDNGNSEAKKIAEQYEFLIDELDANDADRKFQLINNIAYVYIDQGLLGVAERYIHYLIPRFHVDPYPTATLGLMNLRKGNIARGEQLYYEAIQLAQNIGDKNRIRQKLNLELAKRWLDQDVTKAKRFLEKVIDVKDGSAELSTIAKRIKTNLVLSKIEKPKDSEF